MAHPLHDLHWSTRLSGLKRQGGAAIAALLVGFAAALYFRYPLKITVLMAWCVYCVIVLFLTALLVRHSDALATRRRAQWDDPGAFLLFLWVIAVGCFSLVAVALAINIGNDLKGVSRWGHLGLVFLSLAGGWLLIQAAFALHYARIYYQPSTSTGEPAYGLAFPDGQQPDYLDFLYYSAVIGMTSQVSDITTSSRHMRRLTLVHGLLSFAFNLIVLAIAINVLASHLG